MAVYPILPRAAIPDYLGRAKYFTTLDLASVFHQVLMDPVSACQKVQLGDFSWSKGLPCLFISVRYKK